MTRNINSDAENCQAEVGVPRGAFTPDGLGASYSGVTCPGGGQFTPGGYFLRNTPVSMADVRHKTVRAVHSVGQTSLAARPYFAFARGPPRANKVGSSSQTRVRRGQVHYPDQRLVHDSLAS